MLTRRASAMLIALLVTVLTPLALTGCADLTTLAVTTPVAEPRPAPEPRPVAELGSVDCRVAKCIALTFDGGPGKDTPELLDALEKEEVPATFFLLGKNHVKRHPETVRRMAAEGHEIANHTWTHGLLNRLDPEQAYEELDRTQRAIEQLTGQTPTLMRPPQGRTDSNVARICRTLGLAQILWTVTAKDYLTTNSDLIEQRVLAGAERDGIILLHDIYPGTVPAVPGIIQKLKKRGYTLVTVPQLFAPNALYPGRIYRDAWAVRGQ